MIWFLLLFVPAAFGCLVMNGRHRLKAGNAPPANGVAWPAATVIVPVYGRGPATEAALAALLALDYPDYEVVFVTEKPEEPAAQLLAGLLANHVGKPAARHVVGRRATGCSQKNQNMLAGAAAADPRCSVFAFADSTHLVPTNWLEHMVSPLLHGTAAVTTGYHRVLPGGSRLTLHGRGVTVLVLYLMQLIPRAAQIWGGNMAMKREIYDSLAARLWARVLSDDVGLTRELRKRDLRIQMVPAAESTTPLRDETLGSWWRWTARQWLNLKFTMPGSWLCAGLACHLLTLAIALALIECALAAGGWIALETAWPFLLFLFGMATAFSLLKSLHLGKCSYPTWACAGLLAVVVASAAHLSGLFAREIQWGNKIYTVDPAGFVTVVTECDS